MDKIARAGDGAIHVRLCGEVHHLRDLVLLNHAKDRGFVAEVHFFEDIFGMIGEPLQICQMTCISQAVQVHQALYLRLINDVLDEIGADKSSAAGNK